jgi:hypothetical protein
MPHRALGDEVLDRTGKVFDRRIAIHTVLTQQADMIRAQALQRAFHCLADAFRAAVGDAAAG